MKGKKTLKLKISAVPKYDANKWSSLILYNEKKNII